MSKSELRKQYKELRKSLKNPERDEQIAGRALAAFGEKESFFVYLSFASEVGTETLIGQLQRAGKTVCVPRVLGGEMSAVPYSDKLEKGAFGLTQPSEGEDTPCEVAFVPLLAVDKTGTRLGYGGGYYDKFFAKHPEIMKVGLAYEGQLAEMLPREDTDIPLDAVVTEKVIYDLSRR